jgi:actin-related protein
MVFRRPVEKGYLVNWEAEKEIWEESFFDDKAKLKVLHTFPPVALSGHILTKPV